MSDEEGLKDGWGGPGIERVIFKETWREGQRETDLGTLRSTETEKERDRKRNRETEKDGWGERGQGETNRQSTEDF